MTGLDVGKLMCKTVKKRQLMTNLSFSHFFS